VVRCGVITKRGEASLYTHLQRVLVLYCSFLVNEVSSKSRPRYQIINVSTSSDDGDQGVAQTTNNLPFYDASLYRRITNADALSVVEETYQ